MHKIMEATKQQIDQFFSAKTMAIAGASNDSNKFGNQVYKHLKHAGYTVLPVNPKAAEIDGDICYKSISNLPDDVESILLATPKQFAAESLELAISKGIKNVWIQLGAFDAQTKALLLKPEITNKVNVVFNRCIFMYAEPILGVHKFHRFCIKLLGKLPK